MADFDDMRVAAPPAIDAQTERATRAFMDRIRRRHPVREAYLFGSRARQTHAPDSDADVAVILAGRRAHLFSVVQDMAGVAFDVLLETGVHVEPLPIWEDEFRRPETFSNPALLDAISRDGLKL